MRTVLCALALLWANVANAGPQECMDATCRINRPGGVGTGVVYAIENDWVCILTNAHVVGAAKEVKCEFFRSGKMMQPLTGAVYAKRNNAEVDAALVAIPVSVFGAAVPKPVPLAADSSVVPVGERIVSVGCPYGKVPSILSGNVLGYSGTNLLFVPPPANGRSGSAIFDATGEQIVGLLFGRSLDDRYGYACSIQALHRNLAAAVKESDVVLTQCGPGGGCPQQDSFGQRRQQRQQPQQGHEQGKPWPGFGEQKPTPAPPQVDLTPILNKLDELKQAMPEKVTKGEMVPIPDKLEAPQPAGPDPVLIQILQQQTKLLHEANESSQSAAKSSGRIETALEPVIKFQEKFASKPQEPAENKLETKIAHVLWTVLVVGVVFVVVSLLVLFNKGVGLIGKFTADRAAKHPENARYQAAAERWQELDEDLLEFSRKSPALRKLVKAPEKTAPAPEAPKAEAPATQAAA